MELVIQDRISAFPALKSFLCTIPPNLLSLSFSTLSGVLPCQSSDPAAPETGDRLHTAALLHDHVYVRFHDLCDFTNLEINRQSRPSKSGPSSFFFENKTGGTLFLFWIILFFLGALIAQNSDEVPGAFQRTSPSRPQ